MLHGLCRRVSLLAGRSCRTFSAITSNTFWALELKHGDKIAAEIPRGMLLDVRLAALQGEGSKRSVVKVDVTSLASTQQVQKAVLCTLRSSTCEQVTLNSSFSDNAVTQFSLDGDAQNSVFLSGVYRTNDNLYDLDPTEDWGFDKDAKGEDPMYELDDDADYGTAAAHEVQGHRRDQDIESASTSRRPYKRPPTVWEEGFPDDEEDGIEAPDRDDDEDSFYGNVDIDKLDADMEVLQYETRSGYQYKSNAVSPSRDSDKSGKKKSSGNKKKKKKPSSSSGSASGSSAIKKKK